MFTQNARINNGKVTKIAKVFKVFEMVTRNAYFHWDFDGALTHSQNQILMLYSFYTSNP